MIPYHEAELKPAGTQILRTTGASREVPLFSFPVSPREAFLAVYSRQSVWLPYNVGKQYVNPRMIPDNVARAVVTDARLPESAFGGRDMFGVLWEYVPVTGGSMVRPENHLFEDASQWREKLVFPEIDRWDWEGGARDWEAVRNPEQAQVFTIFSGFWFERLISFMGFEAGAMALIDPEQKPHVHALFQALSDFACRYVDHICDHFPVDGFFVHDDWGTMVSSIFSPEACREMIVPYMRQFTDRIHRRGKFAELHSCGKIENQVPNIIAAGWDSWCPMLICDIDRLFQEYGDRLIFAVAPEDFDPDTSSEEEQRAIARRFAQRYCVPGKPCFYNNYALSRLTPAFTEELYRTSRQLYAEME